MRITVTNGNSRNRIRGSRVRAYSAAGALVYETHIPAGNPAAFVRTPAGERYARTLKTGLHLAGMVDELDAMKSRPGTAGELRALFAGCKARVTATRWLAGLGKPAWQ